MRSLLQWLRIQRMITYSDGLNKEEKWCVWGGVLRYVLEVQTRLDRSDVRGEGNKQMNKSGYS